MMQSLQQAHESDVNLTAFYESSDIPARLIRAVVNQLGGWEDAQQALHDIANHGANGGFHGFTSYTDTVDFFNRNRAAIITLVEAKARDFEEDLAAMVADFKCLAPVDSDTRKAIYRALGGAKLRIVDGEAEVANALAWFACEEVANAFNDFEESA